MNFYKYLKQARENLNLTQEDAAEKIGVSITTIQNWEKHRLPDKEWWNVIISTYKLNKDEFARHIVNTVSPDEEIEENENEKEKYFPFGWFVSDKQEILKKMVLTEAEREFLGLYVLYTLDIPYSPSINYNLPYEYVQKVGSFNILKMRRDLKEKLGCYYDNVVSYLINHPEKNFDIYSLSAKEVFETFPFFSKKRIEEEINCFINKDKILLAQLEPIDSCYKDSFKIRKTECFDSLCTFKDKYFNYHYDKISLYEKLLDDYIKYPSELMQISREENNIYGCLTEEGKRLVQWYKKES